MIFTAFFSPFKKNKNPENNAPAVSSQSTVHRLTRARSCDNWYCYEYELGLVQSGSNFGVEMRSHFIYKGSGSELQKPWSYQKSFENLVEAQAHFAEILADAYEFGKINSGDNYYWRYHLNTRTTPQVQSDYQRPADIDNGKLANSVATGRKVWTDLDLTSGEVVRQLWGRAEPAARTALLYYANRAPFTYGYWSHWKWLYKQAEAADDMQLLTIMISRLDLAVGVGRIVPPFSWTERVPSAHTLNYLKGRARRYLRILAQRQPQLYIILAVAILKGAGGQTNSLDLKTEWVSLDILFGASGRYTQNGHGRGRYVSQRARPTLAVRDEQVPPAWDARPDLLLELYTDPTRPWQILEWALKMLRLRQLELPPLSDALALQFLQSQQSPLLVQTAVAQVSRQLLEMQTWPAPELTASAFYWAKGSLRRQIIPRLAQTGAVGQSWQTAFATQLAKLLAQTSYNASKFSGREKDAAGLLARVYLVYLTHEDLLALVPVLLGTPDGDLQTYLQTIVFRLPFQMLPELLQNCNNLNTGQQERLIQLWLERLRHEPTLSVDLGLATELVENGEEWIKQAGWRILEASSAFDEASVADLWNSFFRLYNYNVSQVISSIFGSISALRLLMRNPNRVKILLDFLLVPDADLSHLTQETFALLLRSLPTAQAVKLATTLPPELWESLRQRFAAELVADGRMGSVWHEILATLPNDTTGQLRARFLLDPILSPTFQDAADESFLKTSEPAFAPLLVNWLERHPELFGKGSPLLLTAAMSKMLEVRNWALRHLETVGVTTPFALRLLESGLPESIAAGKTYFEAVPAGDTHQMEYVLAICDSPDKTVQKYGREYLQKRRAQLPLADLTRQLAEHPDPTIQELVAATLLQEAGLAVDTSEFDSVVLRSRNRGRRVKELVKQRVGQQPAPNLDKAVLLEMARSRTGRDAEWAMQQLVRLALAGETVEGLEILGAGGI